MVQIRYLLQFFSVMFRNLQGIINRTLRSLRRAVYRSGSRRGRRTQAGFVLPTVAMVSLVVVLLSVAILLRSFDRAKVAQFNRVDQAVAQAAAPALDRAKAKIKFLTGGGDRTLAARGVPSDRDLQTALNSDDPYKFVDEDRLQVSFDGESITSAWRFPVDTDNDGQDDTYTLYGIYLQSPDTGEVRTPLQARTPPRTQATTVNSACAGLETSASLIGANGWSQSLGRLKKSIFVYVANVPIAAGGTQGFSALEYQQDAVRLPLTNNAVVYRDDLAIAPGDAFRLNGRILTNANLFVTAFRNNTPRFYQVSGTESCFYPDPENAKILVGGNVINGVLESNSDGNASFEVDLHPGIGSTVAPTTESINSGVGTVNESPLNVLSNGEAYAERLEHLVAEGEAAGLFSATTDPDIRRQQQLEYFEDRTRRVSYAEVNVGGANTLLDPQGSIANDNYRPDDDWIYPAITDATGQISQTGDGNNELRLLAGNNYLFKATDPDSNVDSVENEIGDRVLVGNGLPAIWYLNGEEVQDGDVQQIQGVTWEGSTETRTRTTRIQKLPDAGDTGRDGFWESAAAIDPEEPLDNYGGMRVITGAGVYLREESFLPPPILDNQGGTIIAGRYVDPTDSSKEYEVVWPDTMPMSPVEADGSKVFDNSGLYNSNGTPNTSASPSAGAPSRWIAWDNPDAKAKGDLQMRASVIYHYASAKEADIAANRDGLKSETVEWSGLTKPTPIACVSSYYDPSTIETAKNTSGLPWNGDTNGKSNSGIVYPPPSAPDTTRLTRQANLVFPNGRFVNPTLKQAVDKSFTNLTLAEQAAVDSTMCAFDILGSPTPTSAAIPHGAIYERSFLNAREVVAIDEDQDATTDIDETFPQVSPENIYQGLSPTFTRTYELPLEDRQPSEIRVTVLDMEELRKKTISQTTDGPADGSDEYLLPMSGIIYASRDDALPDATATTTELSATDLELDPTRRPSGIMIVHSGSSNKCLARSTTGACQKTPSGSTDEENIKSIVQEKGLILASNVPVYIKGEFNLHSEEEFDDNLAADWSNFYTRSNLEPDFACRSGDPRLSSCTSGDDWRPAVVLADAVTLLSEENATNTEGFRFGYRYEGDFDLRNNAGVIEVGYDFNGNGINANTANETVYDIDLNGDGDRSDTAVDEKDVTVKAARLLNGFNAYNDFAINGFSSESEFDPNDDATPDTYTDANYIATGGINSSYFNNYVTPIQRRGDFPEYLMEICLKSSVSACGPDDWVVTDGITPPQKASALLPGGTYANIAASGTTARPPAPGYQRFPRRVAFKRIVSNNALDLMSGGSPIPIGLDGSNNLIEATYAGASTTPASSPNALWFMTNNSGNRDFGNSHPLWFYDLQNPGSLKTYTASVQQPHLVPALQVMATTQTTASSLPPTDLYSTGNNDVVNENTSWLMPANSGSNGSTYNLILGTGDIPNRKISNNEGEFNGGLPNLPRTLEEWRGDTINILGSFIQFKRSEYGSAPYLAVLNSSRPDIPFDVVNNGEGIYRIQSTGGRTPYFAPATRNWGFDVGLLSQPPDLFALKFASRDSDIQPDEFLREVSRSDEWIVPLLCSTLVDGGANAVTVGRPDKCP
ncbi:MAG: hormogonium polysaccharide biosynthesis protein HpsA [Microcoleaceae cyanobacterium]